MTMVEWLSQSAHPVNHGDYHRVWFDNRKSITIIMIILLLYDEDEKIPC